MQHGPALFENCLLARLTPRDRDRLAPHLVPTTFPQRMRLVEANHRIDRCFFLETGIASVVASSAEGKQAEVGIIGNEGMIDVAVAMNTATTPLEAIIQMPGKGFSVATAQVTALAESSSEFRHLLLGFAHSFLVQVAQSVLATVTLTIEDRLARWLLMSGDRADSDELPMTHEFLSLMLGVRRAGVTDALHHLVAAGSIATSRGHITILDRARLEQRLGESYGVPASDRITAGR